MFGISSLIIISCISDGFNDVINDKLSGIDGHIRIKSYLSDEIRDKEINILDSLIIDKINTVIKFLKKLLCLFQSSQKNSATRPSFFVRYIFLPVYN